MPLDFDWNLARSFLAAAETGTFSAAARQLGLAQPTLGRHVASLEESLGVDLFERLGHGLQLTETGLALLEEVRAMRDAADKVALMAAGQAQTLEGVVRIAAGEAVAAHLLPTALLALHREHPAIEVELVVSNRVSDLRQREADIALRHVRPSDEALIAKQLRSESGAYLYGSRDYLASIDNPSSSEELASRGRVLAFDEGPLLRRMLADAGYAFADDRFALRCENHLVQWQLCKAGFGLCVMMEEVGDAEPLVQRAGGDAQAIYTFSTWLTAHRELRTSRRIRVVFDLLERELVKLLTPTRSAVGTACN